MTHGGDSELRELELHELRKRAYGPNPDIHRDPLALSRLRELEARTASPAPRDTSVAPEAEIAVPADDPTGPAVDTVADPEPEPTRGPVVVPALLSLLGWLAGLRRSTVLVAVGSILAVSAMAVALILVQRVQTDPLQTGAVQVARLQPDGSYQVPAIFGYTSAAGTTGAQAFEEFHGLRMVIGDVGFTGTIDGGQCLNVFSAADVTDPDSQSFEGSIYSGCTAGGFPAIVQINLEIEQFPGQLGETLPNANGLQFVYDDENNEVVVFAN